MGRADEMKNLGEGIVASYDARVKAGGELVKDTHDMLKRFQTEHKEMADRLSADLTKGEEDRVKDFKAMVEGIQVEQKDRNKAVADLLEKFAKDHEAMADELRKSLAKGETGRIEDFKEMMEGIQKFVADVVKETKRLMDAIRASQGERNKEVLDLLEVFKTEREEAAANWHVLTVTMAEKRGIMPKVGVEVKPKVKPKAGAEKKVEVPVEEEEEIPDLEGKLLAVIREYPNGITLAEVSERLGVATVVLGRTARKLIEKGMVRREEKLYFPVMGE